jgi:septal ring factor EnvC (AmiA/AmiB activator)
MEPIIVATVGALAAIAVGFITGLFARKKSKAEWSDQIAEAAGGLLEQYRHDNADLRVDLMQQQAAVSALQNEMGQTRADLATTRTELAATRGELAATRTELAGTRSELITTRNELITTRGELIEMRKGVRMLIRQIEQLGETPAWQPRQASPEGHDG